MLARLLGASVVVISAGCGAPAAAAPPAPASPAPASPAPAPPEAETMGRLTDLVVERITLADVVAAAKFGTPDPIDDPAREQQVLDEVAAAAPGAGVEPAEATRFFRDQIEANKVVQRGLYQRWTAEPDLRPAQAPDLAAEVRPRLDRLTTALLGGLRDAAGVRIPAASCDLAAGRTDLDALHRTALKVALRSVCAPPE
ncbi:chorismate mutase [Pseudonocardia aurantiaca]